MSADNDTICALSTASGISGVAIIRVSGNKALAAAKALTGLSELKPRYAYRSMFRHPHTQEPIDSGLLLYFPSPHSFTGEDVVEFHIHGSRAVIEEMIELLDAENYARPALPGEFTQRAFDSGKMDLLEVEALADLLESETRQQKAIALNGLSGWQSKHVERVRERLVRAMAMLEAYIDFPDEEIPESALNDLREARESAIEELGHWLGGLSKAGAIRDGIRIAIVGAPNAGKSSLLNVLAKRDVAIVSPVAGTTRDMVEVRVNLGGYLVLFQDTAGVRAHTDDVIENEGIRRAIDAAKDAHLIIHLIDATVPNEDVRPHLSNKTVWDVYNKLDEDNAGAPSGAIGISTKGGQGIGALIDQISDWCAKSYAIDENTVVVRLRQKSYIEDALEALGRLNENMPLELQAELFRQAVSGLSSVLGVIVADDLLEEIFSSFCIGK